MQRDGYLPGVPCWVDTNQPDPDAAATFYGGLFGWVFEDAMPPGSAGKYLIARLEGGDVAAIASQPEGAPPMAVWNTYVWVDSADEAAARVLDAGGRVVMDPFDVMDAGRMAVLTDPEGATFRVWAPGAQHVYLVLDSEDGYEPRSEDELVKDPVSGHWTGFSPAAHGEAGGYHHGFRHMTTI